MKLLLTNDDGIHAPGLAALQVAASKLGEPVIVASALPESGMSYVVTWERSVRLEPRGDASFALHGTPADCARIGLLRVALDARWVLSGINHGASLGADVYYSGTVAAVREAVLHGWSGIAVSHYLRDGLPVDWERATRWMRRVLADLLACPIEHGLFYNVNLPQLAPEAPDPEVVWCPLDPHPLPLSYRHEEGNNEHFYDGIYAERARAPGADVDLCFGSRITITAIRLF